MSPQAVNEIQELKKQTGTLLLAHFYADEQVQEVADFVGDSYQLALFAKQSPANQILMAGVVFMAESIKILNPQKKVLVPDSEAGCSLVTESPFKDYLKWRLDHPEALMVTYINSSAQVKAISDVIVTSSNASKIISSIPKDRKILFGPDKNLGGYLSRTLNRPMDLWQGSCQVHIEFSEKELFNLIAKNPSAIVIAHPECDQGVLNLAHVIGSTSRLLEEVKTNPAQVFIVATEPGIFYQMKKLRPDAKLIQAPNQSACCGCAICPYMKLNTVQKIKNTLLNAHNLEGVKVSFKLAQEAQKSLERMVAVTQGQGVSWPQSFKTPSWVSDF